jgi:SCY1-like protein 2
MKNSLLPKIKKLCVTTTLLSVRVNCLICLGKLLSHLDKWLVIDEILPMMQLIPSREPAVIMGIVGKFVLMSAVNYIPCKHVPDVELIY